MRRQCRASAGCAWSPQLERRRAGRVDFLLQLGPAANRTELHDPPKWHAGASFLSGCIGGCMKYVIQMPAVSGDIVPLAAVADAKAKARATAGKTAFHRPAYDGSFMRYGEDLLTQARTGELKVCNQWGVPGTADEIICEAERSGQMVVVYRDESTTQVDLMHTHLCALNVSVRALNDWAGQRGDEFGISSEGVEWLDERGPQVGHPSPALRAPPSDKSLDL